MDQSKRNNTCCGCNSSRCQKGSTGSMNCTDSPWMNQTLSQAFNLSSTNLFQQPAAAWTSKITQNKEPLLIPTPFGDESNAMLEGPPVPCRGSVRLVSCHVTECTLQYHDGHIGRHRILKAVFSDTRILQIGDDAVEDRSSPPGSISWVMGLFSGCQEIGEIGIYFHLVMDGEKKACIWAQKPQRTRSGR